MANLPERQEFYVKGKDIIEDPLAPVVSDEFVDKTREEGDYQGQTIEVASKTKIEDDLGTGEAVVIRAYEFTTNPQLLRDITEGKTGWPDKQEFFNSHYKGIMGMLWSDGLQPVIEIEPRLIFSKDRRKYMIMVHARPALGHSLLHETQTLTEILNVPRHNTDAIQRGVSVPPSKKKKASRATKAPK